MEFVNRARAVEHIQDFAEGCVESSHIDLISNAMVNSFEVSSTSDKNPAPTSNAISFVLSGRKWVIRDDDLKLRETFIAAASMALASYIATQKISASALVNILSMSFSLFCSARKKGARLSEDQCVIIIKLKEIKRPIPSRRLAKRMEWDVVQVERVLHELMHVICADGTVISLVTRDLRGRWLAVGV